MIITQKQLLDLLESLGANRYDLWLPETHSLAKIINENEQMLGIVYGKFVQDLGTKQLQGRGALVATDSRVILIDRKPLYISSDEFSYTVISGINYRHVGVNGTIVLHTRLGNITMSTLNRKCATLFTKAIEQKIFNEAGYLEVG